MNIYSRNIGGRSFTASMMNAARFLESKNSRRYMMGAGALLGGSIGGSSGRDRKSRGFNSQRGNV